MYCFFKFLSSWAPSLFYIWRTHYRPRWTLCRQKEYIAMDEIVGNKTKGWISKRLFQENKARQIFRKINISYPLIRTCTCTYQGLRNVHFSENLTRILFLKNSFWNSLFCHITEEIIYGKSLRVKYDHL